MSHSGVPGPAPAPASAPGDFLEMQFLRPHPGPPDLETLGVGSWGLCQPPCDGEALLYIQPTSEAGPVGSLLEFSLVDKAGSPLGREVPSQPAVAVSQRILFRQL